MKSTLFIPKKLKIGFQERTDTFTGKLAYVIYYDEKNVLRKEKSWNGWRDKKIEPIELDNTPMSGFVLNKGVRRYSDWGSGRSVIRVHDHRDFEFEISVDNLIGILMHSDVSKRDIVEECIFAWAGTELVLLPCNSEAYQSSIIYTDKQSTKVTTKELVAGRMYSKKKTDDLLMYLGYHEVFAFDYDHSYSTAGFGWNTHRNITQSSNQVSTGKKHVFFDAGGKYGDNFVTPAINTLSSAVSDDISEDFAATLDSFHKTTKASRVVSLRMEPIVPEQQEVHYSRSWYKHDGDTFTRLSLVIDSYRRENGITLHEQPVNVSFKDEEYLEVESTSVRKETKLTDFSSSDFAIIGDRWYGHRILSEKLAQEIHNRGYGNMFMVLENGNEIPYTRS